MPDFQLFIKKCCIVKTVVLKESQVREVVLRENLSEAMDKTVLGKGRLDALKKYLRKAIIAGVALVSLYGAIDSMKNLTPNEKIWAKIWAREEEEKQGNTVDLSKFQEEFHNAKVEELKRCMQDKMRRLKGPKAYDPNEVKLSAEGMVSACEDANYDLVLATAQAWLESAWGTTPRALRTNSVFSVGSYDNGKNGATYSHPDDSVRPYINLMQSAYGITPEKIDSIFTGKQQLVNGIGKRYASSKTYEKDLARTYNSIKAAYPTLGMSLEEYIKSKDEAENS